jgi:UDP-N-acetylmuramate dehydrogenase
MIKQYENINLRSSNSFGIDAVADRLIEFSSAEELKELFSGNHSPLSGRWNVMGGGCNILFTEDYRGTLIRPAAKSIAVTGEDAGNVSVRAEAGLVWDDLAAWCVERGLWGAENLSHIPGHTGAAPVQNIGAYGAEVSGIITSVETFCTDTLNELVITARHCAFGYRESIFKSTLKGRTIITAVNFRLSKKPSPNLSYGALEEETEKLGGPTLRNIRRAVINIRASKLPDPAVAGNAGSFFKNPVVDATTAERLLKEYPGMPVFPNRETGTAKLAAGWLIEQAGWKGLSKGRAGVYPRQALILVNNGGATGSEILALARDIQADVKAKFGVEIDTEVNIW